MPMARTTEEINSRSAAECEALVDASEAETNLPQLLDRVQDGETITITRHGKPVARLVPASGNEEKVDVRSVIEELRRFQEEQAPTLGPDLSIRDLVEKGRK